MAEAPLTCFVEIPKGAAHFFSIYKDLERKKVTVEGWFSREDAEQEIEQSRRRFRDGAG